MNLIRYIKALLSARHIKRIKTELQSAYSKLEAYRQREELEKMYFYKVGNVEFRMVPVEGGTFMKGENPDGSKFRESVEVTLESFLCGETPVTEELWEEVMGKDEYYWWRGPRRPVCVNNWDKIQIFISKLNELTGKSFRLLTDAEWEYAAKGGNKTKGYLYSGSNCPEEIGWVDLSRDFPSNYYDNTPLDVKMFLPNELGIYDMTGNVWEFCETSNLQEDDYLKDGGHIIRGGDCDTYDPINNIQYFCWPCDSLIDDYYHNIGFRLALSNSENIKFHSHQCESDKQTRHEKDVDINEYINGLLVKLAKAKDEIKTFEDKESENRRNAEEAVKLKDIETRSRAENEAKGIFQVNNVKFMMIPVEGGTVKVEEKGESHNETIEGFMCGETLVTVELWEAVMGDAEKILDNDPENLTPQSPAEVWWGYIFGFLRALNAMTGKEFRILSHKEWTFAEQEGKDTIIIDPKRGDRLHIDEVYVVKSKPANKLGIYDMDTYEWSSDSDDAAFWKKNWLSRSTNPCDYCYNHLGFRLALSLPKK